MENQQISNDLAADFCSYCGSLVDLDTLAAQITCFVCKNKLSFQQFTGKPIKTTLKIIDGKQWLQKYKHDQDYSYCFQKQITKLSRKPQKKEKQKRGKAKMTIKQKCPKCQYPQLKYYTMQTRSADQGSTVFYQCQSCGHHFSQNN